MRRFCNVLRSSSCLSADLASDTKPEVPLTLLREVTARDAPQPLAPTGRPPLGSFPPCSPSTSKTTCAGLRSSCRLPTLVHLPTATLGSWLPLLRCRKAPGTGPFLAYTTRLSPLLVRLAPALSTSPTCSTSRAGFTPTRSRQALSALFCRISAGTLPPAARWLTRTRLCWQRKKNGKPRAIKMGEFLRSAYAKRLVNLAQVHLRTKSPAQSHQWGAQSARGRAKPCVIGGGTIEPLDLVNGTLEPLVAADLDLVNMIRAALRTHFSEASSWTEWQHQSDSVTTLPSGRTFSTDRGAEQGRCPWHHPECPRLGRRA